MKKVLIIIASAIALSICLTGCGSETTDSAQTQQSTAANQENAENQAASDATSEDKSETEQYDIDFFSIVESNIKYIDQDEGIKATPVFSSDDTYQIGEYTLSRTLYMGSNTLKVSLKDAEIGELQFFCSPGNAVLKSGDTFEVKINCNPSFNTYLTENKLTFCQTQTYVVPSL